MPPGQTFDAALSTVMVEDLNSDGLPNYGDTVRFAITPAETPYDQLTLVAYTPAGADRKDQQAVMSAIRTPSFDLPITLASGVWQGGPADVVVQLLRNSGHRRWDVVAELIFTAAG